MFIFLFSILAIAFLGFAADRWGVDSRPTFLDPRYPAAAGRS